MKEIRPSIQYEIKHYLSDLKDFSESLMKALIKFQDLTRCNQQLINILLRESIQVINFHN